MRANLIAATALIAVITSPLPGPVHGHVGDRILPIYEISDSLTSQIDLKDGSIDDWEPIGRPSATALEFVADDSGVFTNQEFNPADLDFRIWLGWSSDPPRIYAAIIRVDDRYVNEWSGIDGESMGFHDHFDFLLDADHNGGNLYEPEIFGSAQWYRSLPVTPVDRVLGCPPLGGDTWYLEPPYADGGGGLIGESPVISVTEFYVTPFSALVNKSPDDSVIVELTSGAVVGLAMSVRDVDQGPGDRQGWYQLPELEPFDIRFAHLWVDGLLLDGNGAGSGGSVVEAGSWGRIKASLTE